MAPKKGLPFDTGNYSRAVDMKLDELTCTTYQWRRTLENIEELKVRGDASDEDEKDDDFAEAGDKDIESNEHVRKQVGLLKDWVADKLIPEVDDAGAALLAKLFFDASAIKDADGGADIVSRHLSDGAYDHTRTTQAAGFSLLCVGEGTYLSIKPHP